MFGESETSLSNSVVASSKTPKSISQASTLLGEIYESGAHQKHPPVTTPTRLSWLCLVISLLANFAIAFAISSNLTFALNGVYQRNCHRFSCPQETSDQDQYFVLQALEGFELRTCSEIRHFKKDNLDNISNEFQIQHVIQLHTILNYEAIEERYHLSASLRSPTPYHFKHSSLAE